MLLLARAAVVSASLVIASVVLPAAGCGAHPTQSQAPREFDASGTIRGIDLGADTVTIAHDDVPGYMPAMTMPFTLASDAQMNGLNVGDPVGFRFRAEGGGRHVIVSIRRR